jgi:type VI secretion system secreted protein VgrG
VVVGHKDDEILTDQFGRVKVQFHWDRLGKKDENSSCWIRVAQPLAGKRWGASFWPRVGQEVVVEFLEGDPEQPLITGSVYNAVQRPPYLGGGFDLKHPHDPRLCGIKTNSTLGGQGFNELRFNDTKGKEQVFIRAERNLDVRAQATCAETVGGNRHLIVGGEIDGKRSGCQWELVYKDKHLQVRGDQVEQVAGDLRLLVGGGDDGGGNLDLVVKKDRKERIEGDQHGLFQGDRNEHVGGNQSLSVGGHRQEKIGGNHVVEAGTEIQVAAAVVAIQGNMVLINSGGAPGVGTPANPTDPADAQEAAPHQPAAADESRTGFKSAP